MGKAQLAAASQKRGRGGGSKGIHLEDSSAPGGVKWRKRSNQPDSSNNCRPQYEDTFEDSDDSNESFDGPFSGPSSSAVASSTTGTLPSHPSDGRGVFHSASPCLCIWADTSLIYIVDHFFSLNVKAESSSVSVLITFSHRKSKASDYGLSDSTVTFVYVYV